MEIDIQDQNQQDMAIGRTKEDVLIFELYFIFFIILISFKL